MTLYEFYGDGCPHCEEMESIIEGVEADEDVEIEQLEVWYDDENAEKQSELNDDNCAGVPYFHNTETDEWICGEASKEELTKWVRGESVDSGPANWNLISLLTRKIKSFTK